MPKKPVMKPARVIETGPWQLEEREAGPNSPFGSSTVVLDGAVEAVFQGEHQRELGRLFFDMVTRNLG